eukprot:gene16883-18589_t
MDTNPEEVSSKKRKVDGKNNALDADKAIESLERLNFVKVLWNDVNTKTIFLHGRYTTDEKADNDVIIKLEKCPFEEKNAEKYFASDTRLEQTFNNDIYSNYTAFVNPDLNPLKAVSIMPATEKHLMKYSKQQFYLINETPKDYKEVTLPHIKAHQYSLQWVYNILEHKAETDRIIFEDTDPENGFVLIPDLKWNEKQLDDLHLSAIVMKRNIFSIRDLNKQHLPLLKNILCKGKEAVLERYGMHEEQFRVFFHYHPTYYHLHLHFTAITNISAGCAAGRAHLLDEVIDNIENIDSDYYKKRTLPFVLGNRDPLLQKFIKIGRVKEHSC